MGEISRRELLRTAGLGLGVLGGGVLLGRLRWSDWLGGSQAEVVGPSTPLPGAQEAAFYETFGGENLNCAACHGELKNDPQALYCHTPHTGQYVKCNLCPHECVISEGARGHCRVRENQHGRLHSLVFGAPCAVHIDPIEKKPFFHFLPATQALSLATAGCNLRCLYCQNWSISQSSPEEVQSVDVSPKDLVALASANGAPVLAYTYSEPVIFYEYMLESARQSRKAGLRNVVISAGYINREPLKILCETVDAIKIDLKGFNEEFYQKVCGAELAPVLEAIKTIAEHGVHLEIVNLVVPTLNDDMEEMRALCRWVAENLGPDVPIHFSRFHPDYQLKNLPPTPQSTLEQAWAIAREEGIHYAYLGNVPGHRANNTFCHRCGELIIGRQGYWVTEYHIVKGECEFCAAPIPGIWPDVVNQDNGSPLPPGQTDS